MNFRWKTMRMTLVLTAAAWLAGAPPAGALLATHDCSFCHDFHGAPSYSGLLKYSSTEVLCLTCHAVAINGTDAAAVHNPYALASDQPGYITCRECHDPHDNYVNANGTDNIKLVGIRFDPATGQRFATAVIRAERIAANGGLGAYREVIFADRTDFNIDGTFPGSGACQVCHSPQHQVGTACTDCHAGGGTQHDHAGGFL